MSRVEILFVKFLCFNGVLYVTICFKFVFNLFTEMKDLFFNFYVDVFINKYSVPEEKIC